MNFIQNLEVKKLKKEAVTHITVIYASVYVKILFSYIHLYKIKSKYNRQCKTIHV